MKHRFFAEVWEFCEFYELFEILPGGFAVFVFEQMIGRKGWECINVSPNVIISAITRGGNCGVIKTNIIRKFGKRYSMYSGEKEPVFAWRLGLFYVLPCAMGYVEEEGESCN